MFKVQGNEVGLMGCVFFILPLGGQTPFLDVRLVIVVVVVVVVVVVCLCHFVEK